MFEKMTAKGAKEAAKMGVDTSGSLACAHVLQEGLASSVVVVWPDRVEVHSKGRAASITGQGAGVQSMPTGSVASVDNAVDGLFSTVRVHGSGHSLEFKAGQNDAGVLRQVILDAAQAARR